MGYRGTGKHICGGCKKKGIITPLTEDNCPPSVFKKGCGKCRDCMNEDCRIYDKKHALKRKETRIKRYNENREFFIEISKKYHRTVKGKHNSLKSKIKHEGVLEIDPILNLNFYTELIRDNECHYCLGPLDPVGHNLDCVINEIGHLAYNVVPCCKSCNQKKMNDTTYEEMMLLAPALREIRRRREMKECSDLLDSWLTESARVAVAS